MLPWLFGFSLYIVKVRIYIYIFIHMIYVSVSGDSLMLFTDIGTGSTAPPGDLPPLEPTRGSALDRHGDETS